METLVKELNGTYLAFEPGSAKEIERIRKEMPSHEQRDSILRRLGSNPTTADRYEAEYQAGLYHSYKPGIDLGALGETLNLSLRHTQVLEIGGGPSTIAEYAEVGVCLDLKEHPRLKEIGVTFVEGDICQPSSVEKAVDSLNGKGKVLTVLSYCLDRVSDQVKALRHFAEIIKRTKGMGMITVYLPARPSSPGVEGLVYSQGEWVTEGRDPESDYVSIVRACEQNGLTFTAGGLTSHYSVSLDSFEELGCWVMVFKPA